jgi:hypothetical protein
LSNDARLNSGRCIIQALSEIPSRSFDGVVEHEHQRPIRTHPTGVAGRARKAFGDAQQKPIKAPEPTSHLCWHRRQLFNRCLVWQSESGNADD